MQARLGATACILLLTAAASGGGVPDYDFEWRVISDPGNPDWQSEDYDWVYDPDFEAGRVDYLYRLSTTPVTVNQWYEFVLAYAPYAEPNQKNSITFTGPWIIPDFEGGYEIDGPPEFVGQLPTSSSLRFASRYVNWLHNGKVKEQWAFESGVYDTSTFGEVVIDGTTHYTDQTEPSPGATFWIPRVNEWVKGMYWDPNRFGAGQGGYWPYPHSKTEPPISGFPEDGGETNAGKEMIIGFNYLPVGSYPDVQSPWGLLDGSGGEYEWLTTLVPCCGNRMYKSSRVGLPMIGYFDQVDWWSVHPPTSRKGFRIASVVPGPVIRADMDGDGLVGSGDLNAVLGDYGCASGPPTECAADLNYDGYTDTEDLLIVLTHYGAETGE